MNTIQTVTGKKKIDELGIIDPHEHFFIDLRHQYSGPKGVYGIDGEHDKLTFENSGAVRRDCYLLKDNLLLDNLETAVREAGFFWKAGGQTVIEVTPPGVGRDIKKLCEVARRTGIDVVAATGTYTYDAIPAELADMDKRELAAYFVRELTKEIDGTSVRAGVIGEMGTSETIHPLEEKGLKAAALAHLETGAKIYVHLYPWGGQAQTVLDILERGGVSLENVCLCHLDVILDRDQLLMALDRGAYVEFDNFGKEFYIKKKSGTFAGGAFASDVERVRALKMLCAHGYRAQLLLSNDICLKNLLHQYGGWGYDHILHNIVPMMRSEEIGAEEIHAMVNLNPKQFLE